MPWEGRPLLGQQEVRSMHETKSVQSDFDRQVWREDRIR